MTLRIERGLTRRAHFYSARKEATGHFLTPFHTQSIQLAVTWRIRLFYISYIGQPPYCQLGALVPPIRRRPLCIAPSSWPILLDALLPPTVGSKLARSIRPNLIYS